MSTERDIRACWLARGISPTESLFFGLVVIIEEDEPALYAASVLGMEGALSAMGHSEDEAAENAIELFKGIVDSALADKLPLNKILGSSTQHRRVAIPIQKAGEALQELSKLTGIADSNDDWRQFPVISAVLPSPETVTQ